MTHQVQTETVAPSSEEMQRIAGYRKNNLWSDLKKHLTYQLQETIEQVVAFNARNEEDFRDATGDIRVLLDAQKASVTYSLDDDYNEIVSKLFTRLDDTREGAERTQQKYADLGVQTYIVHDERTGQYINRVSESVDGTDGEHYPKDKWLKSYKFQTPTFELVGLKDDDMEGLGIRPERIFTVTNAGTTMIIGSEDDIITHAHRLIFKRRRAGDQSEFVERLASHIELPEGINADEARALITKYLESKPGEGKALNDALVRDIRYIEIPAGVERDKAQAALTSLLKSAQAMADINNEVLESTPPNFPAFTSVQPRVTDGQTIYHCTFDLDPNSTRNLNIVAELAKHGVEADAATIVEEYGWTASSIQVKGADVTGDGVTDKDNREFGSVEFTNTRNYRCYVSLVVKLGRSPAGAFKSLRKLPSLTGKYSASLLMPANETLNLCLMTELSLMGIGLTTEHITAARANVRDSEVEIQQILDLRAGRLQLINDSDEAVKMDLVITVGSHN